MGTFNLEDMGWFVVFERCRTFERLWCDHYMKWLLWCLMIQVSSKMFCSV